MGFVSVCMLKLWVCANKWVEVIKQDRSFYPVLSFCLLLNISAIAWCGYNYLITHTDFKLVIYCNSKYYYEFLHAGYLYCNAFSLNYSVIVNRHEHSRDDRIGTSDNRGGLCIYVLRDFDLYCIYYSGSELRCSLFRESVVGHPPALTSSHEEIVLRISKLVSVIVILRSIIGDNVNTKGQLSGPFFYTSELLFFNMTFSIFSVTIKISLVHSYLIKFIVCWYWSYCGALILIIWLYS